LGRASRGVDQTLSPLVFVWKRRRIRQTGAGVRRFFAVRTATKPTTPRMTSTTSTGTTSEATDVTTEPASSAVARIGFASPPVVAVEVPRVTTVALWTSPATPPPAITASVHFRNG